MMWDKRFRLLVLKGGLLVQTKQGFGNLLSS